MKAVTEKKLKEVILDMRKEEKTGQKKQIPVGIDALEAMMEIFLEEVDELTVSKLRPMSEANKCHPLANDILAWHREWEAFITICVLGNGTIMSSRVDQFVLDDFAGWIPMPRYEPE